MNNLKFYRNKAGLSQAKLAELAGLSQNAISYSERIGSRPRFSTSRKIYAALKSFLKEQGVTLGYPELWGNEIKEEKVVKAATPTTDAVNEISRADIKTSYAHMKLYRIARQNTRETISSSELGEAMGVKAGLVKKVIGDLIAFGDIDCHPTEYLYNGVTPCIIFHLKPDEAAKVIMNIDPFYFQGLYLKDKAA